MLNKIATLTICTLLAASCAHKSGHHDHDHDHDKHGKHDHDEHDHDEHGKHDHDHDHYEGQPIRKMAAFQKTDWATVKKVTLSPGQATGIHSGPGRLIVALNDYKIRYEEPGKPKKIKTWHMGDVHWHGAGKHNVTNIGETLAEFLIVSRTNKPLAIRSSWADKHNHSDHHKNIFENSWAEVSKVTLKQGQKTKPHEGSYRVIVSLSTYDVLFAQQGAKAHSHKENFMFGQVHFHQPGVHAVTNIGTTEARFLTINYKK